MWQLGPIWKATWRPKYDSRPEIDYNLLFRRFVGLATDDAGVEPRGVFTALVDARKVKDCPAEVKDLGAKWKMVYWDYSSKPRRKRSKVWAKS